MHEFPTHAIDLSPLTVDRLGDIRRFLQSTLSSLGCAGAVDPLVLAVDEVCANLAEHGTIDGAPPGPVRVTVRREGIDAVIVVEDEGPPFDPADAPPPDLDTDWQDRRIGGLGWFLVRQMVDELHYDSNTDPVHSGATPTAPRWSNRLTLIKRGAADAAPSGPG